MKQIFKCTLVFALFATEAMASVSIDDSNVNKWSMDANMTYNGASVLRTGSISDSETTTVTLTFSDVSSVDIYVRTSTEAYCDRLLIEIDGCNYDYSGEQDEWQQVSWDWGWQGDHVVTLIYSKDGGVSSGEDCGWVWFDGVDTLNLNNGIKDVAMDATHPWIAAQGFSCVNSNGKDVPYMQSSVLLDGEESWMSYAVEGADTFVFQYCVDSEENSDFLVVSVDGVEIESFSGSLWYSWCEIPLPDRKRHIIRWTYRKDVNGTSCGNDSAYIWFEGIEKILTNGCSMNLAYPWTVDYTSDSFGLRSGAIPDGDVTSISRTMTTSGAICFMWKVSSEQDHDFLRVFRNDEQVWSISGEQDWQYEWVHVSAGDVITWSYEKDENGESSGEDCCWIDFTDIDTLEFMDILNLIPDDDTVVVEATKTMKLDLNTGREILRTILGGDAGVSFASSDLLPWTVDESGHGMRSATFANGASSWMSAIVIGNGIFSFDWLSSNGTLTCYVDGEQTTIVTGTTGWEHMDIALDSDSRHEIRWVFEGYDNTSFSYGKVNEIVWDAPEGYDDPDELIVPATVSVMATLDLLPSPRRLSDTNTTIRIAYDPSWVNASTAMISINGKDHGPYGSNGILAYMLSAEGEHSLSLILKNAEGTVIGEPLTASFVINCDPIPELPEQATSDEIVNALTGSADQSRLVANITTGDEYAAYRSWAHAVKSVDGITAAGTEAVKNSTQAWLSFALGVDRLIGEEIISNDIHIVSFNVVRDNEVGGILEATVPSSLIFEVAIDDVAIGSGSVAEETLKENLKKVLGVEGAARLDESMFSSDNINITFGAPVDGKARFTVTPLANVGNSFFMRVKVK